MTVVCGRDVEIGLPWTDERVATLKTMWRDGYTAGQIATHLGGVTRNSVISKVHRSNLSAHSRINGAPPPPVEKLPPTAAHQKGDSGGGLLRSIRADANAKAKNERNDRGVVQSVRKRIEREEVVAGMDIDGLTDIPPDQSPLAMSLLDVKADECHWPLNNPTSFEDFRVCGAASVPSRSYCPRHHRLSRGLALTPQERAARAERAAVARAAKKTLNPRYSGGY